jgi:hypothetical protein
MLALLILEGVVVAILALLVLGLLRSHAEILRQLHELREGAPPPATDVVIRPRAAPAGSRRAHDLVGETPDGEAVAVGVVGAPHHTLLAFLSSGCATCTEFWAAFAAPDRLALPPATRLVVATRGVEAESVSAIRKEAPADLTVVMSTAGWESYAVPGSPYFVLVDGPAGVVAGEGTGTSWSQVQSLMAQALDDGSSPDPRTRRTDRGRMATDDAELLAAGIGPGHASLFGTSPAQPVPPTQPVPPAQPVPSAPPGPTAATYRGENR